jgi:NAD(P)-dependent dehydrogenase (short-subunit alcohol dehydrogenase family)
MRTIFISGATGNLGRAVVKRFLDAGDKVYGTLLPGEALPEGQFGEQFVPVTVDLNNEAAAEMAISNIISKQGSIDVAVLTAGGFVMGDIAGTNSENILAQFKLNVETAYHAARPIFLQMLAKGSGRIFMVGSRPGLDMRNSKGMVAYGLTKSLIFRLAELMNDEAKGKNVVTTVIVPSTIDTPQNRKSMPDADFTKWVRAEEIAELVHYHSSENATALRETMLKIYGGS